MDYYNINLMVDDLSVCITKAFDLLDSDYVEEKFYSLQKNEMIALCRGFVDRRSELYEDSFGWNVRLEDPSGAMEQCLNSFGIAHSKQVDDDSIVFSGPNAFDLLSLLYGYSKICYSRKDPQPSEIIISVAGVTNEDIPKVKVFLKDPNAVMPSKQRPSDVGYDLTIIKVDKVNEITGVIRFDTGVVLQPDIGWYCEISPRSSFGESGWVMTNSIGTIDKCYTGTVKVPLLKVSPTAADIKLPYRGFQFTLKPCIHTTLICVSENAIVKTERAASGFGSTDTKRMMSTENNDISNNKKTKSDE